ncbi:hypothetical protein ACHQM5_026478 [Ranunculus cassubicifolius]
MSYLDEAEKEIDKSVASKRPREMVQPNPKPLQSQQKLHQLFLKAIIYGGLPFSIGDNIYFHQFVQALCSVYRVPSAEMLRGRLLTEMYSTHFRKKLAYLPSFVDFTICFDGWTDISGNSIYAFMILKEESEDVLDILDLSDVRHTAIELKDRLLTNLLDNGVVVGNALACVTDSPSMHPNVIPIRCSLHGFNLVAKDVAGFPFIVKVCKINLKLVNYFTSSHFWGKQLRKWQEEKKIPHFLSTFCETRWYSLARVCLGVATYDDGFRHCLELSKKPGFPPITNIEVSRAIINRHHFADNLCLLEALKPIIDIVGNLEKRTTTLADLCHIMLHETTKVADLQITVLKDHVLCAIGKKVKEFQDPIYFVALFLHPACKKMALSRMMTGELIMKGALEIAKAWHFNKRDTRSARDFWEKFAGSTALLRRFAMKVFSIVPHSAPCEQLFSTLGIIKTKPRNRLQVKSLNMLAQIKCDLASQVCSKKKTRESVTHAIIEGISMSDFDPPNEDTSGDEDMNGEEMLDEVIEKVNFNEDSGFGTTMDKFFDFDAFERDNTNIASDTIVGDFAHSSQQADEEFSIDAIMKECS